jgi:putative transposase
MEGDRAGKLVSPSRRRDAGTMLVERLRVSERRACRITGQHRSTQRHRPRRGGERDDALRARLRKLSADHPRWGYRLAWGSVRDEGWAVNRKKIQRLWREEGLRVPQRKRKPQRLGESTVPAQRLRAERPNHVWALDFQFDTTVDGRTLKLLHVVDEHTREALAIRVARSIDADHAVRVLDQIVRERGVAPELVRMDNGPEMTANAVRDWCRLGGSGRSFIEPGSPWQNPFVESFGSRVRDEVLSVEAFDSVLEAQTVIEDWRTIYNHKRPHSSLGWTTPAAYAASLNRQPGRKTDRLS